MSTIDLYEALKRIPDVSDEQAREAANTAAGDPAVRWVLGLLVAINIATTVWLATGIAANHDGIAANRDSIAANSERLARIETLLEERLPPRSGR